MELKSLIKAGATNQYEWWWRWNTDFNYTKEENRKRIHKDKDKLGVFDMNKAKGKQFRERETLKSVGSFWSQVQEGTIPNGFSHVKVSYDLLK